MTCFFFNYFNITDTALILASFVTPVVRGKFERQHRGPKTRVIPESPPNPQGGIRRRKRFNLKVARNNKRAAVTARQIPLPKIFKLSCLMEGSKSFLFVDRSIPKFI